MRKLLILVSALAAACGGGSSKSGGTTPVSGTISGATFTPADVKALAVQTAGSTTCTVTAGGGGSLTFAASGLAIELTSYANACGDFASATCAFHKSAVTVTVLLAMLDTLPPYAAPTIPAGSYPINASTTTINPDGSVVFAQATPTDTTCGGGNPTQLKSQSGTLRIDSVTGPITGHVSVSFVNSSTQAAAGSLEGDFSAPLCSASVDVCTLVTNATEAALSGQPTMLYCTMPGTCQ